MYRLDDVKGLLKLLLNKNVSSMHYSLIKNSVLSAKKNVLIIHSSHTKKAIPTTSVALIASQQVEKLHDKI